MNSAPQLYVTADLIRNTTLAQQQQLPSTDIFEIPDLPVFPQNANYIKSINHNAMTHVMNEVANQRQRTPSITTKQTDVSIQLPIQQNTSTTPAVAPEKSVAIVKKNTISKNTLKKKVIIEDK